MAERQTKEPKKGRVVEPILDGKGKRVGAKVVNTEEREDTPTDDASFEEGNSRRKPKEVKTTNEKKEKPVKEAAVKTKPKNDEIAKALAEAEGNDKVISAAKKLPFFKFVNKESWENTVKKKDKTGEGLFRMRVGNLLRGARTRSKAK